MSITKENLPIRKMSPKERRALKEYIQKKQGDRKIESNIELFNRKYKNQKKHWV